MGNIEGAKEIAVESSAQYLAICKSTGTLSLSLVSVFKYPCELDCSAASFADQVYYITDLTTLIIPACVGPQTASVTATLTSTGATTPPTGFATLSKNTADNSFTILISENDPLITG